MLDRRSGRLAFHPSRRGDANGLGFANPRRANGQGFANPRRAFDYDNSKLKLILIRSTLKKLSGSNRTFGYGGGHLKMLSKVWEIEVIVDIIQFIAKKKQGNDVDRGKLWAETYKRKDGNFVNDEARKQHMI